MKNIGIVINEFVARDRKFTIVRADSNDRTMFCAIEKKYIKNGKLTKTLSGVELNASDELWKCLQLTKDMVEMDFLMKNGMDRAEALATVSGMLGKIDLETLRAVMA